MKKFITVIFALCLVLAFVGCASKPPSSGGMPPQAANARREAPADVLVGVGNAKMSTVAMSRTTAANRARVEISQILNSMVQNMVRDYTAASEVDPSAAVAFQENMTVTLSRSELVGSVIYWEGPDSDGMWWAVVHLNRTNVAREITQAQAAARLAVPAMASFDAEARMNTAFDRAKEEGR